MITAFNIAPLSDEYDELIQSTIDQKTKPVGALGQLESLAFQCARIQFNRLANIENQFQVSSQNLSKNKITLTSPNLIVFAGDHGVASQGVSIAPSEVTAQMVANFAQGGAAINVFCQQLGWEFSIIDSGILNAPDPTFNVINHRLGSGTEAINLAPAMTVKQVNKGFALAKALIQEHVKNGCNIIAFGEMGIGNTTSASAIMSAVMQLPAKETVGKGTGVNSETLIKKQQVIEAALVLHAKALTDPINILACLSGFEIVSLTGAMLAAAEAQITIIVDGFICTAAAMLAVQINPLVKDYMVFAHCSGEQGHIKMLEHLNVTPLLNLGLRLGEGSGAALALPLVQAAAAFYNDMASFAQAEVTNVT